MNKMLTFLTAPITAFFYPAVYKDAVKSPASRGVLYCLYLAVLATILMMMFLSIKVMPEANAFVKWTQTNMPVLIWTPAGVSLESGKTVTELTHPKYGKIALFDMTKTTATAADLGTAYVLVTPKKIFIKRNQGQIEERDITGAGMRRGQQPPPRARIDGAILGKLYENLKKMMVFMGALSILILSFLLLLIVNLFYSLAGLLLNLLRNEKIGYGAILNLTCFATSAAFTITWLRALTPLGALHFPVAANILINLGFMFFAFKVTDTKKAAV